MAPTSNRPQDLVFTLFGDYLLHRPGPAWVGSLIALLRPLGLSEAASRTVLSRMTRKGWLTTSREGRLSYYDLSARGRRLLQEGEERIYHPPRGQPWDGSWTLVAYSIPEERRNQRDKLRIRLAWLGFGSLGNGLWISPHTVQEEVRGVLEELDLTEHVELFRAEHLGSSEPGALVRQCWDLETLAEDYREFIRSQSLPCERCRRCIREGRSNPEDCFVRRFRLVHEYRAFPLLDPYLPPELLPDGWPGEEAAVLFERYHDLLTEPAERFVDSVLVTGAEERRAAAGA